MSIFSKVWNKVRGREEEPQNNAEMPQFVPTPSNEMPQFSDAHIQLIERTHQVDSKEDMINYIDDSNLSMGCKQMFKNIMCNLYDRNIIMSNNSKANGVEIAYYQILIEIFPNILSASTKNDRMNPAWIEIYGMIKTQLGIRLTRTEGLDRERNVLTKATIASEINMKRQGEKK